MITSQPHLRDVAGEVAGSDVNVQRPERIDLQDRTILAG